MIASVASVLTVKKARQGNLTSLLYFLFLTILLSGCDDSAQPQFDLVQLSGSTMGTTYNIKIIPRGAQVSDDLKARIDNELDAIVQSMSTYVPTSELSLLNNNSSGEWHEVSSMLYDVVKESIAIGDLTDGALDITVGPLVELWGFGATNKSNEKPDQNALLAMLETIGYEKVTITENPYRLKKTAPVRIDLSSTAKGYAADKVASLLESQGLQHFLVEIGGEVVTKGRNQNDKIWLLGVETPSLMPQGVQQAIAVSGVGVATSGDYRNYFEEDGVRYSHLIDPNTGYPITNKIASVTVIADNCMRADGLATAFSVMGATKALALAEEQNIAVYLLVKKGDSFESHYSSAFKPYLKTL